MAWDHLIGQEADDIALVAVGGYGRSKRHQRAIEHFLTPLWDCNLKVGTSVLTIAECAIEDTADLSIITTMIKSRLLSEPRTVCKNEGSYSARAVSWLVSV